ncbi:MAG: AbrB/MazE/SpoVT family DNA-binding domain-containing protein [Candidatus Saccharimonadales bacterium]
MSTTTIKKWGNSLALRIPAKAAQDLGLRDATVISLTISKDGLYLSPVKKPKPSLRELVDKITPGNSHDEVDWGEPAGKEIW